MKVFKLTRKAPAHAALKAEALAQGWSEEEFRRCGIATKFLKDADGSMEYTVRSPETQEESYALFSDQYANSN